MALNPQTLLSVMLFVGLLTACASCLVWIQDRRQTVPMWMALALLLLVVGLISRMLLPFLPGIILSPLLLLTSFGFIWMAGRRLRELPPRPLVMVVPIVIWLTLCCFPWFREAQNLRVGCGLFLLLLPAGLLVRELWLQAEASAVMRWTLLALSGFQVAFMLHAAIRAFLLLPHRHDIPFQLLPGFARVMLDLIAMMVILSFGMMAIAKEQSERRYRKAARHDFLTGVGNRRHFEETLQRHFRRAQMSGTPLSLIMLDADGFKAYNDFYGHRAGDQCLRLLARTVEQCCRPTDLLARYGGEEFAVLLPDTDGDLALAVAERMRQGVYDSRIRHEGRPEGRLTISLGVATLAWHERGAAPEALIEAADRALYRAKREGRNLVRSENGARERPRTPAMADLRGAE